MVNLLRDYHPSSAGSDSYQAYRLEGPCKIVFPELNDCIELAIVAGGESVLSTQKCNYYLAAGDALMLPPTGYRTKLELKSGAQMFLFFFRSELLAPHAVNSDGMWLLSALEATGGAAQGHEALRIAMEDACLRDCTALAECLILGQHGCREATFSHVAAALLCSMLELLSKDFHHEDDHFACNGQTARAMRECVEYIHLHYAESLAPKDLAQRCMMSESNFRVFFSRITGMSLKKYLTQTRIHEACNLLRNEEFPLQHVAYLVGYEDPSTFYRNFSKLKEMTPAQYRNQYRSNCHEPVLRIV